MSGCPALRIIQDKLIARFFERQSELSELISLSWLDLSLLIVGCEPLSETKQKGDTGITDLYRLTLVPKSPKRLCRNAAFGNMPNISQHAVFLMHCMKYHTTIYTSYNHSWSKACKDKVCIPAALVSNQTAPSSRSRRSLQCGRLIAHDGGWCLREALRTGQNVRTLRWDMSSMCGK